MPNRYSITCASSQEHDKLLMRTIFEIVKRKSQLEWNYCEEGNADVVIFDYDTPPLRDPNYQPHLVIGYSKTSKNADKLLFSLAKPVRTRDLLELLANIEHHILSNESLFLTHNYNPFELGNISRPLVPISTHQPIPEIHTTISAKTSYQTATQISEIDRVAQLIHNHQAAVLRLEFEQQIVYVDGQQRLVYSQRSTSDFNVGNFNIGCLVSGNTVDQAPNGATKAGSLTDFLYHLTISEQPVRLMSKLPQDGEFQLTQWPNLASSRNAKLLIKLAAYFSKRSSTLSQAAHELSVSLDQLTGFINATYCQGFVSYSLPTGGDFSLSTLTNNHTSTTPISTKQNSLGNLFGRIRQKFGI